MKKKATKKKWKQINQSRKDVEYIEEREGGNVRGVRDK